MMQRLAKNRESCQTRRVLVATDCLSEGVQQGFNVVLHYDLPWMNRLEQREGRVDRYGQPSRTVRSIRYFSPDSAVDGVVLDVLLNKRRSIRLAHMCPCPGKRNSDPSRLERFSARWRCADADQPLLDFGEQQTPTSPACTIDGSGMLNGNG